MNKNISLIQNDTTSGRSHYQITLNNRTIDVYFAIASYDPNNKDALPYDWVKYGYSGKLMFKWWRVDVYGSDSALAYKANPTTENGRINFNWLLEPTEENKEKLLNEILKRLDNVQSTWTSEEIKKCMDLFKQVAKETNNIKVNGNIEDAIDQYCFGNYQDECEGIFFPNSEIEVYGYYDLVCLILDQKDKYSAICRRNNEDISFTLDKLLYSDIEIKRRNELNKSIKSKEKELILLSQIKRVYKKDGSDFSNLKKCFKNGVHDLDFNIDHYTVKIGGVVGGEWVSSSIYCKEDLAIANADFLENKIKARQEKLKKEIEELNIELNSLHSETLLILKKIEELKKIIKESKNDYFFKQVVKNEI